MNAPSSESDTLSTVCDAMASAYRRQVLRYLAASEDDAVSVRDLVDELLDHDAIADDRRHVLIKLHHIALPKLADAGFIEYDARTQTARASDHPPLELGALPTSIENA